MSARHSVVIRLAGESGEGVISSGDILTQAAARGGYYTQTFRTFPAEIKGGPCMYQFRLSDEPIWSHGKDVDLLVCFNQEAWDLNWDSLGPEGVILYDISEVTIPEEYLPRARPVRMEELAKEIGGSLRAKNMVAVGAVTGVIEFDTTPIEELVLRRYAHKEGVADANIAALHAGADEAADLKGRYPLVAPVETEEDRMLISGNQAIAVGAIAAGVDYFAGYPITPASDILEWLSVRLPQTGGLTIQCEDEIASLASVVGASYAGAKAMTATSGPGLSLMGELIGYAGTAEIPVVIVDAQRGGALAGYRRGTRPFARGRFAAWDGRRRGNGRRSRRCGRAHWCGGCDGWLWRRLAAAAHGGQHGADRHFGARFNHQRFDHAAVEDLDVDGALLRLHHSHDVAAVHAIAGLDAPLDELAAFHVAAQRRHAELSHARAPRAPRRRCRPPAAGRHPPGAWRTESAPRRCTPAPAARPDRRRPARRCGR